MPDNQSNSAMNFVRGLHYQIQNPQGTLVCVVQGEVIDVAADLTNSSETFGEWVHEIFSAGTKKQLGIPTDFAHAFLSLWETAEFLYMTTDYYSPERERRTRWNDPGTGINPLIEKQPALSGKDHQGQSLTNAEVFA